MQRCAVALTSLLLLALSVGIVADAKRRIDIHSLSIRSQDGTTELTMTVVNAEPVEWPEIARMTFESLPGTVTLRRTPGLGDTRYTATTRLAAGDGEIVRGRVEVAGDLFRFSAPVNVPAIAEIELISSAPADARSSTDLVAGGPLPADDPPPLPLYGSVVALVALAVAGVTAWGMSTRRSSMRS